MFCSYFGTVAAKISTNNIVSDEMTASFDLSYTIASSHGPCAYESLISGLSLEVVVKIIGTVVTGCITTLNVRVQIRFGF